MSESQVSIGRVKREISTLVNRVAFGGERIVLTSRGKPKAVIVSLEDYDQIHQSDLKKQINQWEAWLTANEILTAKILVEHGGEPVDIDGILEENRNDLEERHDYLLNH
jgi:prevent-host-death family protein